MPTPTDQLRSAVLAHATWKTRLAQAIEFLELSEMTVEVARRDDACAFGKWLHVEIDPAAKRERALRAGPRAARQFHVAASNALGLALAGRKPEAVAATSPGSEFLAVSNQLAGGADPAGSRWPAEEGVGQLQRPDRPAMAATGRAAAFAAVRPAPAQADGCVLRLACSRAAGLATMCPRRPAANSGPPALRVAVVMGQADRREHRRAWHRPEMTRFGARPSVSSVR